MITCPNCQYSEIPGALFCSRCGAPLLPVEQPAVRTATYDDIPESMQDQPLPPPAQPPHPPNGGKAQVTLQVVDSGIILPLKDRYEFTLGRKAEGQPILPDIDLGGYNGYEKGVSRLHATIRLLGENITLTDLGSVNGTRLNNKKLVPKQAYFLTNGDMIALGKLKLQVIIRRNSGGSQ